AHVALRRRGSAGQVAIELRLARNSRIAVDSELLEGDEVGPDVALFEGAELDAVALRDGAGHAVNPPAIAEQQHDVDPSFFQQTRKELRPVARVSPPADRAGRIKQPIAAVEIDLVDLRVRRAQLLREAPEERPHRALQQQDPLEIGRASCRESRYTTRRD